MDRFEKVRAAFRDSFSWLIFLFIFGVPASSVLVHFFLFSIDVESAGIILFGSYLTGSNIFAFFYDKPYVIKGIYPSDGSVGRYIFFVFFLAGFIFVQFLPVFV